MKNSSFSIKQKLWERFTNISRVQLDEKGYVSTPKENLLPGVNLIDFQTDYQQGSGNELENKFRAVHSSSALVANTFAPWRKTPSELFLCGKYRFEEMTFEKKCPTGLSGTPPNLDMFVKNETTVIGVESKFLEYLVPKPPKFSASYNRYNLPYIEDEWWNILEDKRRGKAQYLDVAQLIKHYLGLRNQIDTDDQEVILLYLFWEPTNWRDIDVFKKHHQEVEDFSEQIKNTSVEFVSKSYLELWAEWDNQTELKYQEHLVNLRNRYMVAV